MIKLFNGDCLECMKMIPDKSVDLVVMDPPYNIGKAKEWDKFKDADYLKFMGDVFTECGRVMADNGQLYFFHNDITKVTDLMHMLKDFPLVFSSFIIFPKPKFRRLSWSNPSEANNLRCWFNICEFALLYINSKSVHTEWDKTGWDRVRLDVNNFASLRKYAFDMLCYIGGGHAIQQKANQQRTRKQTGRTFLLLRASQKGGSLAKWADVLTTLQDTARHNGAFPRPKFIKSLLINII